MCVNNYFKIIFVNAEFSALSDRTWIKGQKHNIILKNVLVEQLFCLNYVWSCDLVD